jgi:hypothetical protein
MSFEKARRGRPKGSGLDDRNQLAAVAKLLAANPSMAPTTAIKSIGVTDPSSVRRLRDKFRVVRAELMEASCNQGDGHAKRPPSSIGSAKVGVSTSKRHHVQKPVASIEQQSVQLVSAEATGAHVPATQPPDVAAWFAIWCGLGLTAVSAVMRCQWAVAEHLLKTPEVTTALKQHVAYNEFTLTLYRSHPDVRKTLH